MQIVEQHLFGEIKGFRLGWSPLGPPLMTIYCYLLGDLMIDTGLAHLRKEVLEIAARHAASEGFS